LRRIEYIKGIVGGKSFYQIMRYGVVGVTTNSMGFGAYFTITTYMGGDPKVTMSFVYMFGIVIGFAGNRKWTFNDNRGLSESSKRYLVAYMVGYLINLSILFIFADIFDYKHYFVQLAATFVMIFYFFGMLKLYVFEN